jgi:tetratricopeptide (TPR) repeat protein
MLLGGLARASALEAGVYNLNPPRKYPSDYVETTSPRPLNLVMIHVAELRQINDGAIDPKNSPPKDSLRKSYEKQLAELEIRQKEGVLDAADRVNLSGCLIRMGRFGKAEQLLEESLRVLPPDEPFRCLLLLHRAALYQELAPDNAELQQRAVRFQEEALQSWPLLLPGWNRQESASYRRAEEYAKTSMELRWRELSNPRRGVSHEMPPPDNLFPKDERDPAKKVRFVGDSGKYEAGGIAAKQMDRLPADADQVVLQLVLWRPHDNRLLWLYGELLNARGSVDWAFYLLDYVKTMRWQNTELDHHYQILAKAIAPFEELFRDKTLSGDNIRLQASLLWTLTPRGGLLTTPFGTAASELGGWTAATYAGASNDSLPTRRVSDTLRESESSRGATAPQSASNPLPDWRHLTVSFIAGMVVAVLSLLQWQQWRRQRGETAV